MPRHKARQLYSTTAQVFNDNPNCSKEELVVKVQERLVGFGWEVIAINIAIAVISKLISNWIERKIKKAPATMPVGFAAKLDAET